jgi:hypothetical protein
MEKHNHKGAKGTKVLRPKAIACRAKAAKFAKKIPHRHLRVLRATFFGTIFLRSFFVCLVYFVVQQKLPELKTKN